MTAENNRIAEDRRFIDLLYWIERDARAARRAVEHEDLEEAEACALRVQENSEEMFELIQPYLQAHDSV